jgi:hypothetical protein
MLLPQSKRSINPGAAVGATMLRIAITAIAFACSASVAGMADDLAKRAPDDQVGFASSAQDGSTAAAVPTSPDDPLDVRGNFAPPAPGADAKSNPADQ